MVNNSIDKNYGFFCHFICKINIKWLTWITSSEPETTKQSSRMLSPFRNIKSPGAEWIMSKFTAKALERKTTYWNYYFNSSYNTFSFLNFEWTGNDKTAFADTFPLSKNKIPWSWIDHVKVYGQGSAKENNLLKLLCQLFINILSVHQMHYFVGYHLKACAIDTI